MSSSRKEYYASRDASKVYLLGSFPRWRAFKEQHKLRTDKDVADMLLDSYLAMNRIVCNAETQTETVMESTDMPPVKTSTPSAHSIRVDCLLCRMLEHHILSGRVRV
ncbi:uncharacterized protein LOC114543497 isoform X2 [Dendronephthya gigantea]|uniref:uncharacterized protein LOC114543497 isoform X2 n=1 Tax=Dendronephthya gigantea TaxID=151771 RepID=UPI00106BDED8|nr:uncharacterized protein LOC114543497 isoform X2 [Dendronephthya gigantea]